MTTSEDDPDSVSTSQPKRLLIQGSPLDGETRPPLPSAVGLGWVIGPAFVADVVLRIMRRKPHYYSDLFASAASLPDPYAKKPLAVRAHEVTDALAQASKLLDDLQAEVKARATIIDALASETREAVLRSEGAVRRAELNEQQAKAVDAFLDRALKNRIREFERSAKRREWVIGTVVALVVGVSAILVSHFLFAF